MSLSCLGVLCHRNKQRYLEIEARVAELTKKTLGTHRHSKRRPATVIGFAYLFGVLMIALGVVTFYGLPIGYQSFVTQRAAETWPQAHGTVVVSKLLKRESNDIESPTTMYHAQVVTAYTANGSGYRIREIYVGQSGAWRSSYGSVNRVVRRYKKGSRPIVYYHPDKPWVATLESGVKPWTYGLLFVDTLFVLFGLYLLGYALKQTYLVVLQFFRRVDLTG